MVDEPDAEGESAEPVDDPIVDRPDAADAGPLMAYSATRLESGRCLFSWWAKYLAKLPEYHHPVLGMGSFQHRVIERYVQKCVEAKTEGEGLFATQALDETWAENPSIPLGTWHDTFAAVHWFAQNYRVPWDHVVGAELEWAVTQDWTPCTWHDPGVRRRGRVDLLEVYGAEAIVVDWKTGRAVASQREVEKAWAPRMYGLLALAHNPSFRSVRVIFHYTRYGYRRAVHFELADLERAREEIERAEARFDTLLVNREDASLWPALPGTYCGICGHQSICPQKDAVAALGPISTPDQAVDVARRILYREVALARDREALREWTDATGAVRAGGAVFDHWPMPKWEANVAAVLAACRTHGVPVDQVVRADKKQIEKIGKVAVAFREEALAAFHDVGKTTFKWKREAD